jgi:hypothetical protein
VPELTLSAVPDTCAAFTANDAAAASTVIEPALSLIGNGPVPAFAVTVPSTVTLPPASEIGIGSVLLTFAAPPLLATTSPTTARVSVPAPVSRSAVVSSVSACTANVPAFVTFAVPKFAVTVPETGCVTALPSTFRAFVSCGWSVANTTRCVPALFVPLLTSVAVPAIRFTSTVAFAVGWTANVPALSTVKDPAPSETGRTVPPEIPWTVRTSVLAVPAVPRAGCFALVEAPVGSAERVTSTSRPFDASPGMTAVPPSVPSMSLTHWALPTAPRSSVAILSPPTPGSRVVPSATAQLAYVLIDPRMQEPDVLPDSLGLGKNVLRLTKNRQRLTCDRPRVTVHRPFTRLEPLTGSPHGIPREHERDNEKADQDREFGVQDGHWPAPIVGSVGTGVGAAAPPLPAPIPTPPARSRIIKPPGRTGRPRSSSIPHRS